MTGRFEILEHTADIGLRLTARTPGEIFEAAAEGLAILQGAWFPGEGVEREVEVAAGDREALLVAWLDEVLYLQDAEDVVFGGFHVEEEGDRRLRARMLTAPRGDRGLEAAGVKAATYHRLRFAQDPNGRWSADVYLDV